MNAVMAIKRNYEAEQARKFDEELQSAFFDFFHSDEIKTRRLARMCRDAEKASCVGFNEAQLIAKAKAQTWEEAQEEYKRRERVKDEAHDQEVKDLVASLAGGVTMLLSFLGIAAMV